MKRCKHVSGYTDYPIVELGDEASKKAPVRHITVLSYDHDKYAKVCTDDGVEFELKTGYIYSTKGSYSMAKHMNRRKIERML